MKADNRVLITKKINNFFIHSQFYHYSPNETDYTNLLIYSLVQYVILVILKFTIQSYTPWLDCLP